MQKAQRTSKQRNRTLFLAAGILIIIVGAAVALTVLSTMLSDLPRGAQAEQAEVQE